MKGVWFQVGWRWLPGGSRIGIRRKPHGEGSHGVAGIGAEKRGVHNLAPNVFARPRSRRGACARRARQVSSLSWVMLVSGVLPVAAAEPEISAWITQRGGQAIAPSSSVDGLNVGDVVEVELRLVPGTGGVGSYSVSSRFDAERGNVLDVVSVDRLRPTGFSSFPVPSGPAAVESESFRSGEIRSVAALSFPPGGGLSENAEGIPIARLTFRAAAEGTTAIEVGSFATATDAVLQQDGLTMSQPVHRQAVIQVPEPCCGGQALGAVLSLGVLSAFRRGSRGAQPSQAMS